MQVDPHADRTAPGGHLSATARSILVVESDPSELSRTAAVLESAGYRVAKAAEFGEAKRRLDTASPDLLLTGLRLGAYNGLHLIVRSRVNRPTMAAILTDHALDAVLIGEAQHHHAAFLLKPWTREGLLETVAHSLRHSPALIPGVPLDAIR